MTAAELIAYLHQEGVLATVPQRPLPASTGWHVVLTPSEFHPGGWHARLTDTNAFIFPIVAAHFRALGFEVQEDPLRRCLEAWPPQLR